MPNKSMWKLASPANHDAPPKAIVILLGWWGAQPRQLQKYVQLFTELQCTTLYGVAPPTVVLFKNDHVLREMARKALAHVSRLLLREAQGQKLSVVAHVMSNAGGMVWQHIDQLLRIEPPSTPRRNQQMHGSSLRSPRKDNSTNNFANGEEDFIDENAEAVVSESTPLHGNTNLDLVRKRLNGQIYDSAPAYPDREAMFSALDASRKGKHHSRIATWLIKGLMMVLVALEALWNKMTSQPHRMEVFWEDLRQSPFSGHQAFIYSSSDTVTRSEPLEALIGHRKTELGRSVSVLKLQDSEHVMHYRTHPNMYKPFVKQFLDEVVNYTKSNA